jgi:hypothetical protein
MLQISRRSIRHTTRTLPLLALSLAIGSTATFAASAAQDQAEGHLGSPQQQRACRTDVVRHCAGMQDDYAMAECLRTNMSVLRPACRQALEKGGRYNSHARGAARHAESRGIRPTARANAKPVHAR